MHNKIKEIRMRLGLSESKISSLLNISSYKYRRFEDGSLTLTVEALVLLSIMYDIPIDLLVFDKFNTDLIFEETSIKNIIDFSEKERSSILESNLCKYCTFNCTTINYRVVKNILITYQNKFSRNLYDWRYSRSLEISEISLELHTNVEHYLALESGAIWPSVYDLIGLSSLFSKSINEIFEIKNETDT